MADRVICMSKGRIEQIGTADDLYQRPDSLFVAGFIGSPPINLLQGQAGEGQTRVGDGLLPLSGRASGPVVVGIRPEHVSLGQGGLNARVDDLEPHGRETIYHLNTDFGTLRALEAGGVARYRVGDSVPFDVTSSLLFDAASGRRIAA